MATRMLQRRGTAAEWAAQNPILGVGEIGFETDTKVIKLGDGVTAWNDLTVPYLHKSGGTMTGALSLQAPTLAAHAARKQDVDLKVNKAGDTMAGPLMVPTPTEYNHAARKEYVDSLHHVDLLPEISAEDSAGITFPFPANTYKSLRLSVDANSSAAGEFRLRFRANGTILTATNYRGVWQAFTASGPFNSGGTNAADIAKVGWVRNGSLECLLDVQLDARAYHARIFSTSGPSGHEIGIGHGLYTVGDGATYDAVLIYPPVGQEFSFISVVGWGFRY